MNILSKRDLAEFQSYDATIKEWKESGHEEISKEIEDRLKVLIEKRRVFKSDSDLLDKNGAGILDLVRLYEESYEQKKKTLESKKVIVDYLMKLRERNKESLQVIFDKLNQVEDEYCVIEESILNLQKAYEQNSEEIENIKTRIEHLKSEQTMNRRELEFLENEKTIVTNLSQKLSTEIEGQNTRKEDLKKEITDRNIEFEKLQNQMFLESFSLFEQKEKLSYMEESMTKLIMDISNIQKTKDKYKIEMNAKASGLQELLTKKESEELDAEKMRQLSINVNGEAAN